MGADEARRDDRAALFSFWGLVISAVITATVPLIPSERGASPQRQPSNPTVETIIVHTDGKGAWLYREPSTKSAPLFHLLDGDSVDVVCQQRQGELVYAPNPVHGQPARWPVWNRLSNGLWVPDLWTSLPKVPGEAPPGDLPRC